MTPPLCLVSATTTGPAAPPAGPLLVGRAAPAPGAATLPRDGCLRIWRAEGRRIDCRAGLAWITIDHDVRDVVLAGGESFVVDRPGDVLLFALDGPATVVVGPVPAATRRDRRRRAAARLARLLALGAAGVAVAAVVALATEVADRLGDFAAAVHLFA